ncbi:F-box protein At5g07610-like [Rutidosis leptorrhynchoides]|uniref:F-box protein At5g07610-like n=1 Tax=Rutidosis leptorrhynchoides TaxID=125765 RepID=UPI003A9957F6
MAVADHSFQLAADKLSSCQDLITEILSRLPVTSLLRFKFVNKEWYSLITRSPNPNPNPDPPSGVFLPVTHPESGYVFVPFDINSPVKFFFTTLRSIIDPHADFIKCKHSCNGLMLCITRNVRHSDYKAITDKHYVFNPTINQLTTVPGPGDGYHYHSDIHVYSSQTRTCKLSYKLKFDRKSAFVYSSGVYWNNAIH